MNICRHGTDLNDSDCLNCKNDKNELAEWCSEITDKIHDLCLNQDMAEIPTWGEINDILSGNPPPTKSK